MFQKNVFQEKIKFLIIKYTLAIEFKTFLLPNNLSFINMYQKFLKIELSINSSIILKKDKIIYELLDDVGFFIFFLIIINEKKTNFLNKKYSKIISNDILFDLTIINFDNLIDDSIFLNLCEQIFKCKYFIFYGEHIENTEINLVYTKIKNISLTNKKSIEDTPQLEELYIFYIHLFDKKTKDSNHNNFF